MSEQLITVGEATQVLGVTSELPANKCLTKAEFDELLLLKLGIAPESASNGVYIMHKNKILVKRENWIFSNEEASGVAVKTDNCAFVIAKEEQTKIQWSESYVVINGCATYTDENTAKEDYNGKQNTDAIVAQLGSSETYAARYCREYTFPHGVKGYLPALGEWCETYQNKTDVDACMSLIGGKPLYDLSIYNYRKWSSTQYDDDTAWNFSLSNGDIKHYFKHLNNMNYCARPFASF